MTMRPFHSVFSKVAEAESRVIETLDDDGQPSRSLLFMEFYCVEPRCDCRRVVLNVLDTETLEHVASINHGFEPPGPPFEDEGQTFLDPLNPQSPMSDELLEIFKDMIATDATYQPLLERHYAMWKAVVDDPSHPEHAKVRSQGHDDPEFKPAFPRREPVRRERAEVGPNERCPCGSGKKFKKCCLH